LKNNFENCLQLQLEGKLYEAEKCYKKILADKKNLKNLGNIFCNLGIISSKHNKEKEAISYFNKSIKINPKSTIAFLNLALIFLKNKQYKKSINHFLISLEIDKNPNIYFYLAIAYEKIEKIDLSIQYYNKSILFNIKKAESLSNLGNIFYLRGDIKQAEQFISRSVKINSKLDSTYNNLGLICLAKGKTNNAKKNFLKAIKINNLNSRAHYNLTSLINYQNDKTHLENLLRNLKNSKENEDKAYYNFAISKVFSDKKKYNESFNYLKEGNNLKRKTFEFSISKEKKLFASIKKNFNKVRDYRINQGFESDIPIFVVGMPRSGTSLIEQILISHKSVSGLGETNDLEISLSKFFEIKKDSIIINESSTQNPLNYINVGKKYLERLQKTTKNKHIINKLPLNFRWMGFIRLILPNSKIIHCKRNPYDTIYSIYKSIFSTKGNEYSYNLKEISEYYLLYNSLMEYWQKNNIDFYEVEYEKLINDNVKEIKNLLKYCNLSWDKNCLSFYKTKSVVRTLSASQVRKKIYTSSIGKWKPYAGHMREVKNIIKLK
tara:strand:- start:6146 stop:7792 length:1647 start_codon:yes stop_codon:yes gene_type:complete